MGDRLPLNGAKTSREAAQRRAALWLLGGLVLFLLTMLVALQVFGLWAVFPPDTASDTLLLYALSSLNFVAFIVFTFILIRNLLKLRLERRSRLLGSKIKTRLVVYFIALSLLPITAMAVFSYLFHNRSLEKWFHRLPEDVVNEARNVQREDIANQARSLSETVAMLARLIDQQPSLATEQTLAGLVETGKLAAIEIVSENGEVLARSSAALPADEQTQLDDVLKAARIAGYSDERLDDGKGFDAASAPLSDGRRLIIAPGRRADSNLSEIINASESEYSKLVQKQRKVRLLGLSTLGLFTLLQLFAVTWIAIHLARGIATPIQALAEASKEVARGNLAHRVATVADDELALLAESFNQMTAQLAENRRSIEAGAAELREKNLALEERRNYIETVLESLSTGVISLDENDRVTTINAAAAEILRLDEIPPAKTALSEIVTAEDRAALERLLRRARRAGHAAEQTELARNSSPESASLPVALTATALRASNGKGRGVVLVMEDLSELLAAQRAAAWSEVARRMAHEIKNPLTPIQLSAERIARNVKPPARQGDDGGVLDLGDG